MIQLTSKELIEIVGSDSKVIDCGIKAISTDSRKIEAGNLFIAIVGENFDGHEFVKLAIEKGASLALVSKIVEDVPSDRQVLVYDTLEAFGEIAKYNRDKLKGVMIGLTGSAGKTTTKEEIRYILQNFGSVFATSGNFNNHIGVPINLCEMPEDNDFAVLEMGMSGAGEIRNLTDLVRPDIAIITNIYPMHIEFFDEYEGIARAKGEIFEGFEEESKYKTAVINADTDFADLLFDLASNEGAYNIISYGKSEMAVVKLLSVKEEDGKSKIKIRIAGIEYDYELLDIGEHKVYNSLCVISVCYSLGLDIVKVVSLLKDFQALEGRGKEHKLKLENGSEFTLIDDSYSGQPQSMQFALKQLSKKKSSGRKIAVLGKMAELGDISKQEHINIGKLIAELDINVVVGVCPDMKDMLAQLPAEIEQHYFESKDGLGEELYKNILQKNDIVLIKGARYSSRVFEVAKFLIDSGRG